MCNMYCEHCYALGNDRSQSLELDEVLKLIDDLSDLFCCNIIFGHGEPLVYPHFFEVIEHINKNRINPIIMTNGSMFNDRLADKLAEERYRPHRVFVSFDSAIAEVHDENRNSKGAFQKAVRSIKLLTDRGIDARIANVIDIANPHHVIPLLDLSKELDLKGISMLTVRDRRSYSAQQNRTYYNTVEQLIDTSMKMPDFELLLHDPLILSNLDLSKYPDSVVEKLVLENSCTAGTERMAIQPDATVTPCNLMPDTIVGNIREQSIADIWENAKHFQLIREKFKDGSISGCSSCSHYNDCHGGCLSFGYVSEENIIKDTRCTDFGQKPRSPGSLAIL